MCVECKSLQMMVRDGLQMVRASDRGVAMRIGEQCANLWYSSSASVKTRPPALLYIYIYFFPSKYFEEWKLYHFQEKAIEKKKKKI
jgi:hypothetical protein